MKAINHIKASLLALAAVVACTEFDSIDKTHDSDDNAMLQELSVTVRDFHFDDETRSSVTIGEGGASFAWGEDDVIGIFPDTGDQVSFAMQAGAGTQTATFSGGGWALKSSAKYAAYYPHVYANRDLTTIPVSYVGQFQNGNADTGHIGAYDFMAASFSTPENGAVAFEMQHLGALVQLTITVPAPSTLTELMLNSSVEFTQTGTIDLTAETPSIASDTKSSTLKVDLYNVTTTEVNQTVVVYFMTAPVDLTDAVLTATVRFYDETMYEFAIKGKNLQAGKAYRLAEEAAPLRDYVDEYGVNHGKGIDVDGVIWAPVNCGYRPETSDDKGYPYGKCYQWGRKYGQGYKGRLYIDNTLGETADATSAVVSDARVSLEVGQNVLNKDIYYMSSNYQDWTYESNDQLWNSGTESAPVKTIYDPCPLGWRVPTYLEMQSLKDGVMSADEHGHTGFIFRPKTNPDSDRSVFLTIGGRWTSFGYADDREFVGYYWTSKPASNGQAYYYLLHESSNLLDDNIRMYGCSVRCVQDKAKMEPISSLTVNETFVDLLVGQYAYVTAFVDPASVYDILWQSSDTSIATVDHQNGKVTGISEGTVTISASAGGLTASCSVHVAEPVDYIDEYGVNHGTGVIIDNVYWAPVNCGYTSGVFAYGKLYQWGRKYGQGYTGKMANDYGIISETYSDWTLPTYASGGVSAAKGNIASNSNVFFNSNSNEDWIDPQNDGLWNAGTESDPVKTSYDPCPEGWRVPTESEMDHLVENYSDIVSYSGKRGKWFSGTTAYSTDVARIFLPAAGGMADDGFQAKTRGAMGCYWTSGVRGPNRYNDYSTSCAMSFSQSSTGAGVSIYERALGLSVRCVQR